MCAKLYTARRNVTSQIVNHSLVFFHINLWGFESSSSHLIVFIFKEHMTVAFHVVDDVLAATSHASHFVSAFLSSGVVVVFRR